MSQSNEGDVTDDLCRRLGMFRVPHIVISENPNTVLAMMARVIVLRAESRFDYGGIDYSALSPDFEPTSPGELIPQYHPKFRMEEDGSAIFEGFKR